MNKTKKELLKMSECIKSFDKLEQKRKADYSIWGYLYQFDLALYDMLLHNTEDDLFSDEVNNSNPIYQIEVIEDYIKNYTLSGKEYVRLAQVKYYSTSTYFNDWAVIIDLYYDYLFLLNFAEGEKDIKCALFFYTSRKLEFTKEQIKINGKQAIENFITVYTKEAALSEEIQEKKDEDTHYKRMIRVYNDYHNDDNLSNFLNNSLIVHWEVHRNTLIKLIKEKLYNIFDAELPLYSEQHKKDILYSIAINLIINQWQSKKKANQIIEFKVDELKNNIKEIANIEGSAIVNLILAKARGAIENNLEQIKSNLKRKGMGEIEIDSALKDTYYKYSNLLFEQLESKLSDKLNRFKLFNTISLQESISKEDYLRLNVIEEYGVFCSNILFFGTFSKRLLKFIIDSVNRNINGNPDLDIMLNFENDIVLFEHPHEKRECVLLPKTYEDSLFQHQTVLERFLQLETRPKVWYFDKLDLAIECPAYDLNICKPKQLDIDVNEPGTYEDRYIIECMECLNENEPFNNSRIKCIFCERCKRDGQEKSRRYTD